MQAISDSTIAELVGDIYLAGLDARRWSDFLRKLAPLVGASAGTVWLHDFDSRKGIMNGANGNVAAFHGIDDAMVNSYGNYFSSCNVWIANEEKLGPGSVVSSSQLYPDSQLSRTEFYGDWLRPLGVFHALGSVIEKRGTQVVKMSFMRPEGFGTYRENELEPVRRLMPHLQAAVAVHRRLFHLESLAASALSALDFVPFGVILITVSGNLLHANRAALSIATKTQALRLGPGGQVEGSTPAATARLQQLIRGAVRTGKGAGWEAGGALRMPCREGGNVQVFVSPMPAHASPFGQGVAAAVFCSDPDTAPGTLAARLRVVYRMSESEAQLTEALVNGLSLKEFSEQRSTTLNTVRTQLRNAAAKAGAKRQVDLVRIVLTGPAVLPVR